MGFFSMRSWRVLLDPVWISSALLLRAAGIQTATATAARTSRGAPGRSTGTIAGSHRRLRGVGRHRRLALERPPDQAGRGGQQRLFGTFGPRHCTVRRVGG